MIDQKKKEIRIQIRELKKQYSLEDKKRKSKLIFDQFEKLDEFINSKTIMVYWSMDDEVYTHDFVLKYYQEKEIILPVGKFGIKKVYRFIKYGKRSSVWN